MTLLLARLAFFNIYSNVIYLLMPSAHCPFQILFTFERFRVYNCLNLENGNDFALKCQLTGNTRRACFL